jgi:sugar transferase (PEP-CTERM/EpsH1 system associated)
VRSILYLCHRLPYAPDKGCRLRAYHHLKGLARRHDVHLLTFAERRSDVERAASLQDLCSTVEVFLLPPAASYLRCALSSWRPRPLTHSFFASDSLRRRVQEVARATSCDGVVAFSSAMGPYAELVPDARRVLDMVDVDSEKWRQYARRGPLHMRPIHALEARRMRRYEAAVTRRFDWVTLATDREAELLRGFAPSERVVTLRNGIDLDFFRPLPLPRSPHPTLVFTGQMDYFPNVDAAVRFARRTLPRLRARFPDLELLLVGRSPARAIQSLQHLPGVTVTGEVDDVRPYLARGWVSIAPLRIAQGVQNKVLEAMGMGLPVVCSTAVFAGLADAGFRDGDELLVAADEERVLHHLGALLADGGQRERMAAAARRRLIAAYSWESSAERLEELVTDRAPARLAHAARGARAASA